MSNSIVSLAIWKACTRDSIQSNQFISETKFFTKVISFPQVAKAIRGGKLKKDLCYLITAKLLE